MKLTRLMCVCAALAALILMSIPATAGTSVLAKAKVPFEFTVAGQDYPAGDYTISVPNANGIITMSSPESGARFAIAGYAVGPIIGKTTPKLVFQVKDGKHQLSEVWFESRPGGVAIASK